MAQNSSTNPATGGTTSIPGGGSTSIPGSTADDQLSGGGGNDTIWSAPTEWSGLIVSAWSASGPLARNFLGLVDGSPEHCAA
jgi:hypothetical protein